MDISYDNGMFWILQAMPIPNATTSIAPGAYLPFTASLFGVYAGSVYGRGMIQSANSNPPGVQILSAVSEYYDQGPVYFRIRWQVPVANSGQLGIQYSTTATGSPILIPQSVVGTSYGHCQIVGDYILEIPNRTQYWVSIVNPAVNDSTINLMSHGSGNLDANYSIMYESIQ